MVNDIKECPECGSVNIVHNEKEEKVVCKDCGMIYEPMAPQRQEQFDKAAKLKRE